MAVSSEVREVGVGASALSGVKILETYWNSERRQRKRSDVKENKIPHSTRCLLE